MLFMFLQIMVNHLHKLLRLMPTMQQQCQLMANIWQFLRARLAAWRTLRILAALGQQI